MCPTPQVLPDLENRSERARFAMILAGLPFYVADLFALLDFAKKAKKAKSPFRIRTYGLFHTIVF